MLTFDLIQEFYLITSARADEPATFGMDSIKAIEAMLADAPVTDEE